MEKVLFAWLPLLTGVLLLLWGTATLLGPNPRSHMGESKLLEKMTSNKKRMAVLIIGVAVVMSLLLMGIVALVAWDLWVPLWLGYIIYGVAALGGLFLVVTQMVYIGRLFKSLWARVVVCAYILAAAVMWLVWPSWLTITLYAVVLAVSSFAFYLQMTLNFKAVAVIGAALFIYDIVNVYFTGNMMRAAEPMMKDEMPAMIVVPKTLEFEGSRTYTAPLAAGLGLGDVIVPGMLIMIAAVLAYRYNAKGVLYGGLAGYAAGMIAVFVILYITHHSQPALITLYPCVLIGILLAARRAGLTHELLSLRHPPVKKPEEEGGKIEPATA